MPNVFKKKKQSISDQTPKQSTALETVKKLEDFDQTKPVQLSLFELLLPKEKKYSNTIELYDFIPKYVWGKFNRIEGKFLETLEREFECRGHHYKVSIDPARVKDKDGITRDYYPAKREELVEDALRKFAVEGQGLFLDDAAGVTFTVHQLQQELKSKGHTYSYDQLKDALLICAKTNLTVTSAEGQAILVSSIFETLGLQTREDWEDTGQRAKAFVRFNPLVTRGIKEKNFRQFNYEKSMRYISVIARQLHKRMSHHFTQASITNSYSILLTTIIRDFGLTPYERLSHNLRDVETAIEEMKELNVVLDCKIDKILDTTRRNKMTDAKITLIPHPIFADEAREANKRQNTLLKS